jgi:heterodisulfide reductase subunit B2
MTTIPYYPGCTLNTVAAHFDKTARASLAQLGIELQELPQWNCCGACFPLTPENHIGLAGPMNVLIRAKEQGDTISTLCSFCYNTLKRTNQTIEDNASRRGVLNDFLKSDYDGKMRVLHLLEVLRDSLGFDKLKTAVTRPLTDLKVGAYYGCMLLRPASVGIDHPESPAIFEDFLRALGCTPVEFPDRGECCGSHLAMSQEEIVTRLSGTILRSAKECGAEMLTTSCPLCYFNLIRSQRATMNANGNGAGLPVLYFTQILGLALGQDVGTLGLNDDLFSPLPLLEQKGILNLQAYGESGD